MVTQREYLVDKGLAKVGRGRFSNAAKDAIAQAVAAGVVFTDPVKEAAPASTDASDKPAPRPTTGGGRTTDSGVPVLLVGGSDHKLRNIKSLKGRTEDGVTIGFDTCRRCLGHLTLCSCKKPKPPYGVVEILDLPDWTPVG
jgi:hypothetical protein